MLPSPRIFAGVDCIGTISASLVTYASIQALEPDLIINAGTAGGFKVSYTCPRLFSLNVFLSFRIVVTLKDAVLVKNEYVDLRFRSTPPGVIANPRLQWHGEGQVISNRHKKFNNPMASFLVHLYIKPFATQESLCTNLCQYVAI